MVIRGKYRALSCTPSVRGITFGQRFDDGRVGQVAEIVARLSCPADRPVTVAEGMVSAGEVHSMQVGMIVAGQPRLFT